MKRILFVALALVLVASITSVYAEERLSLSGEYRVRGWYSDNLGNGGQNDWDNDNNANNLSYFDQRFRLATTITAAEGVTANMRFDYGEEIWGNREPGAASSVGNGRPTENAELQIDRLYLRLERDMFNFVAGQFNGAFGYTSAFETQQKWLLLRLKLPVIIDLAYIKVDEGAGTSDEDDDAQAAIPPLVPARPALYTEDADVYGLNVMFNAENFGVGAFLGYSQDKTSPDGVTLPSDDNLTAFGLYGNFNLGIAEFKAEFDYFDGELKTKSTPGKVDRKGQQLWVNVGLKLGDAFKIPVHLVYAKGYNDKYDTLTGARTEVQEFQIAPAFGDFAPQNLDPYAADYFFFQGSGEIWDPAGTGGGVTGLMVGLNWQIAEPHELLAQVGYVAPESDLKNNQILAPGVVATGTATYESQYWVQAGWVWNFMPATDFQAIVLYTQPSYDDSTVPDDAGYGLFTKIRVKF